MSDCEERLAALTAVVERVRHFVPHHPFDASGMGQGMWNPWTEPHSDTCPPCLLGKAISKDGKIPPMKWPMEPLADD